MTDRASAWSVTINNPTKEDYDEIDAARQKGWKVDGQLEKGAEGTPHLQLLVRTPQVRFSAVKKSFQRGHIEAARNVAALANYVSKEETRESQLPKGQDKYPSLSRYWELLALKLNEGHRTWTHDDKDALDAYVAESDHRAAMYRHSLDAAIARDPLKTLDDLTEDLIADGFHVESLATNPAVRASWRKWWRAILFRSIETVRQTDSLVQNAEIPVVTQEHNHADDDATPPPA